MAASSKSAAAALSPAPEPDSIAGIYPESSKIIVKRLLRNRVSQVKNRKEISFMQKKVFHAVQEGNLEFLAESKDNIRSSDSLTAVNKKGQTVMHQMAKRNRVNLLDYLIKLGGSLNATNSDEATPLHIAASLNHAEILEAMLKTGKANVEKKDVKGRTALHLACRRGATQCVKILLKYRADIKALEKDGTGVLHLPCHKGNKDLIELLIENFAPKDYQDINGITCLMITAIHGNLELFEFIVDHCSIEQRMHLIAQTDKEGNTCLMHAVINNQTEIIKRIQNIQPEITYQRFDGKSVLHLAVESKMLAIFEICKDWNTDLFNRVDFSMESAMHIAAKRSSLEFIKKLIECNGKVNICNNLFQTPLHLCCNQRIADRYSPDVIRELLKAGASAMIGDVNSRNVLHYAVIDENVELVNLLIKEIPPGDLPDVINGFDDDYNVPLHYATLSGNLDICKTIASNSVAKIDVFNNLERSPLHLAALNGHLEVIQYFLNHPNCEDSSEKLILLIAAQEGRANVFNYMFDKIKIICKDDQGRNTLMLAAASGNMEIIDKIFKNPVDINQLDLSKNTALHHACFHDNFEVVEYLLDKGADILENMDGNTAMEIALKRDATKIIELFVNEKNYVKTLTFRHSNGNGHIKSLIRFREYIVEEILDRCIIETSSNPMDQDYAIIYDFRFIDPGPDDPTSIRERFFALRPMAEMKRERLLNHPLCEKILELKWNRFGAVIYVLDLLVYAIFLALLTYYVATNNPPVGSNVDQSTGCIDDSPTSNSTTKIGPKRGEANEIAITFQMIILIVLGARVIIEIVKLIGKKHRYFLNIQTYLYWLLYICTLVFVYDPFELPCVYEWEWGVFSVMFGWIFLMYKLEQIGPVGIYVLMYERVVISILKSLIIFFGLFVGFSLAFYITLRKEVAFSTIGRSLLKVTGMLLGEFEITTYFSAPTGPFKAVVYASIVLFLLVMSMAYMNFLVGIAVGDTETMLKEASIRAISSRIHFVWEIESKFHLTCQKRLYTPLFVERPDRRNSQVKRFFQKIFAPVEGNEDDNIELRLIKRIDEKVSKLDSKLADQQK